MWNRDPVLGLEHNRAAAMFARALSLKASPQRVFPRGRQLRLRCLSCNRPQRSIPWRGWSDQRK